MGILRVDQVTDLLPDLQELRPLVEQIMSSSAPDPRRTWSGSGELGTVGQRMVRAEVLEDEVSALAEGIRAHVETLYLHISRALRALEGDDREGAARALLDAAGHEENARRLDRAESYARAALDLGRGAGRGREELRALVLRRLARILRARGRFVESRERYEEAYRVAVDGRAPDEAVVAAIGRGNVAVDQGLWKEAEEWYRAALEEMDGETPRPELWQVHLNLSIAHRQQGDLKESERAMEKSEEVVKKLNDPEAAPILENGWGRLRVAQGRLADAEEHFRRGLEGAVDPKARVTLAVNLGEVLLALGRELDAAEAARGAEEVALMRSVVTKLPEVYRLLGEVAAEREIEDAFVFFERALHLVRSHGLPDYELAQTLEAYGRFEARRGDPPLARARLQAAADLYDDLEIEHRKNEVLSRLETLDEGSSGGNDPNEDMG